MARGPYSLGIGLLQQGTPELVALGRVNKHQLPILHGQQVIHDYVHPFPKLPQLEGTRAQ